MLSTTVASPCLTLRGLRAEDHRIQIAGPAINLAVSRMRSSPRVCLAQDVDTFVTVQLIVE